VVERKSHNKYYAYKTLIHGLIKNTKSYTIMNCTKGAHESQK